VFCVDLRTNSDYFPIQHYITGFYNRDGVCLLCGTDWVFKHNSRCLINRRCVFIVRYELSLQILFILTRVLYSSPRCTNYGRSETAMRNMGISWWHDTWLRSRHEETDDCVGWSAEMAPPEVPSLLHNDVWWRVRGGLEATIWGTARPQQYQKPGKQTYTLTTINQLLLTPLQTSRMYQLIACIVSILGNSTAVRLFKKFPPIMYRTQVSSSLSLARWIPSALSFPAQYKF
jgi:hypothetical protein